MHHRWHKALLCCLFITCLWPLLAFGQLSRQSDSGSAEADDQLLTTDAYIQQYKNLAIEEMLRTGVPASISLAQGIVESQSGNGWLARHANNHFGIKCKNWTGETVRYDDDAPNECFRKYPTVADSWRDHSNFLRQNARYAFLFQLAPTDYKAWAYGLKQAGYATNPAYAQMLIKVIEDYHLQQYTLEALALENGKDTAGMAAAFVPAQPAISSPATYPSGIFTINHRKVMYVPAGTSLLTLAHQFGIKLRKLLADNDLVSDARLTRPSLIFLQAKKKTGAHLSHVVQPGETMYDIAQQEGIRLKWLYKRNRMQPGDEPAVGQTLVLRGQASHPPLLRHAAPPAPNLLDRMLGDSSLPPTDSSAAPDTADTSAAPQPAPTSSEPMVPNPWKQATGAGQQTPSATPAPSKPRRPLYHQVQKGETLYSIARRYGVSVQQLMQWNQLHDTTIRIGQRLVLYLPQR
ncbi:MAG: LysM peptidoglycan-binding domain-containing protein [Thermoflavifilum sp.]|nr:LysM peptidoglycan-binding domain-containing protein [Thermoflavifilum sp.]